MIIDSHAHAWTRWPYQPPVPDDESRGRIEQLLFEMDQNGVDQAVIICAQIQRNPDNNEYIAEQAQKYPSRIHQFPDVDCSWSPTYHAPGAADRLKAIAERWPIVGFTHYLKGDDDGPWLYGEQGQAFFRVAAEKRLIASISGGPQHQPALRKVAERFPSMPVLCHHLAGLRASAGPDQPGLKEVLASVRMPNIYVKVSGFYYGSRVQWEYPHSDVLWLVRTLYEHFGPYRLCWGS
ncbi:MAG: amidohydrolase family protein, partial [Chloroflexota bacterium]|nr:amidohydrolase family protein [Chloroflexota bacterium]